MANLDSRFLNNSIHFLNAPASRFGIGLVTADGWLVAENTLEMVSNAHNRTGSNWKAAAAPR
ncbi:MAG: hypothetical protein IPM68_16675 [Flavobacteriales bacterium]|nr:hypothetical protein [Flavobacteriales bacterium]